MVPRVGPSSAWRKPRESAIAIARIGSPTLSRVLFDCREQGRLDSCRMINIATWLGRPGAASTGMLPQSIYRYVLATSGSHQLLLLGLTGIVALIEIAPLALQRRIVDDLVKHHPFSEVLLLGAVYAGVVLVQGGTKLVLNVYRGWIGERAKRDLRRRVHAFVENPAEVSPAAEAQGIATSMIVAEVEPIGGFVGQSISEPMLQGGTMLSVSAYLIHIDIWMALAAFGLFIPQFVIVPLLQVALNRRSGARVRVLRRLGGAMIAGNRGADAGSDRVDHQRIADHQRIDRAFALEMGIFKLRFATNFLMNVTNHLQVVAALLVGGWAVLNGRLVIGGVVAFISGIARVKDPWGDLVHYFRHANVTQIKYRLLADAVNQLTPGEPARAEAAPDRPAGNGDRISARSA
jgi:ABC-type multidrug transport system fused ATPase/permease subunit